MAGVAIEDALELWACSLREVKRRIRPLFTPERVAVSAGLFLDGLLGPARCLDRLDAGGGGGRSRPIAKGDPPEGQPAKWAEGRQQAILGRGRWQADALRDVGRD